MAKMEDKSQLERLEADREVAWSPNPADRGAPRRWRQRILALLITVAAVALAVVLSRETWHAYMETRWTRDGTVRVYVVTMALEVSGRIVTLQVVDNQFVHKDELLMVIDPFD